MKDVLIFMGIFILGYLLTMGLLYVILNLFPRRDISDPKKGDKVAFMKISRGSFAAEKNDDNREPKMKVING